MDEIKVAALSLRETLLKDAFDLEDKFLYAEELKSSRKKAKIPDKLMTFFSTLFGIKKSKMIYFMHSERNESEYNSMPPDDEDLESEERYADLKVMKVMSLY